MKMEIKKTKTFSTYDLGLATTLVTLQHNLLELDKSNPKKVKFVFEDKKNIQEATTKYWNNSVKLPAQSLFNNLKVLKNRLYSNNE